jgi:homoserine kinase type II
MAVYTEPTDTELASLLAGWGLTAPTMFKGIAEGVENSNFLLATREGRFILTIYERRVAVGDLPFFLGATEAAATAGLPAARPVRTPAGALTQTLETPTGPKSVALCTFLDGVSPRRPSAAQTRAAGAALAGLHRALEGFAMTRANDLSLAAWQSLWPGEASAGEALEPGAGALIGQDLAHLSALWPRALPTGLIHADLFPDNVLFTGDTVSGLIDFYFACTDFLAYDLAVMLNAWCFEPLGREFDITRGRALLAGYQSVRPLGSAEQAALPLLARGAALRFYLTRLIDWQVPSDGALVRKKDPREYSARLAFHRAARSPSDYGL